MPSNTDNNLFVWRKVGITLQGARIDGEQWVCDLFDRYRAYWSKSTCPACKENLLQPERSGGGGYRQDIHRHYIEIKRYNCPLCGWSYEVQDVDDYADITHLYSSILKEFELNDDQLPLKELGTHLKNRISDIYSLNPRRFEALVEDIFKHNGFNTLWTQATRDGGVDILLLEDNSSDCIAIVECKRYKKERKVGVSTVRALVGAAISWRANKAYLVTSSDYTAPARDIVTTYQDVGYEIDLVALSDLVGYLGVYNEKIPPLHLLTSDIRQEIISQNTI